MAWTSAFAPFDLTPGSQQVDYSIQQLVLNWPPPPPSALLRISYDPVFVDPTDNNLAHLPIPPLGLRSENLVKPRAVAYKVLARYKVSVEAFCCCGSQKPLNGDQPHQWSAIREAFFLSTIRHPAGRSSIAWELYTTKTLKPLKVHVIWTFFFFFDCVKK